MIIRKARSAAQIFAGYARFLRGLPSFLERRMSLDEARTIFTRRMAERGDNFLAMVEGGAFDRQNSVYRDL